MLAVTDGMVGIDRHLHTDRQQWPDISTPSVGWIPTTRWVPNRCGLMLKQKSVICSISWRPNFKRAMVLGCWQSSTPSWIPTHSCCAGGHEALRSLRANGRCSVSTCRECWRDLPCSARSKRKGLPRPLCDTILPCQGEVTDCFRKAATNALRPLLPQLAIHRCTANAQRPGGLCHVASGGGNSLAHEGHLDVLERQSAALRGV